MLTPAERKEAQRQRLIDAAETAMAARGLAGLRAREIAKATGCALGAIYTLVEDMDELTLLVGSRTLTRLDAALAFASESAPLVNADAAVARLVAIACAYCRTAAANLNLYRALFEHRMTDGRPVPDWAVAQHLRLFAHVEPPLRMLVPSADPRELALLARTLFAAVHGVVLLGLEEKTVAAPKEALERQVEQLVRLVCAGLHQKP